MLPSLDGGGGVMAAIGAIADALGCFPLEEIGRNLNGALTSLSGLATGPELRDVVGVLLATVGEARDLVRKTDGGVAPLLMFMPAARAVPWPVLKSAKFHTCIPAGLRP